MNLQTISKFTGISIVLLHLNDCHSCVCFASTLLIHLFVLHILQVLLPARRSCYQNFALTLFKHEEQCGAPIVGLITFP